MRIILNIWICTGHRAGFKTKVGSFSQYDNANKMRARLSLIGPAEIYQVRTFERPFFRVRLGPLTDVAKADSLLESVIAAGMKDARIVVE